MSWLKDRWEEVTAQVKMGDNRTASTVRAARAKAAPATTRVNTNQPGWSVRKPQQSLTTQQRIDQSYGGGFSGIKNRVIDTFDANTEADRIKRFARTGLNENYEQQDAGLRKQRIESELKASEAKRDAGGYSNYAPTKAANTVMSGAIRSIHGIGQGMGGLVDLVTPGKGTNRLTDFTKDYGEVWDKKREHAGVNKTAYQLAQLPMTLYGYSVGDKAITGTAQLAAKGISAIPKVGAIVPKVAGAVDTISKSKPVVAAATKLDDLALNGTRAQRVGAKLAQSYAKPGTMGNITALNTLQNAGERSSRGQDNNWGTFATDIATGLAMQGGLNLAGQAGAGVVRGVSNRIIEPTTNLVQRGKSELATGLNTLNRGANQHTPYTQLVPTESGRQIVSPRDSGRVIRENLNELGEKASELKKRLLPPLNEGGYVQLPGIADPVVNQQTGETLSQSVEKLQKFGWSDKDIQNYKNTVLGVKDTTPEIQPYKLQSSELFHGTHPDSAKSILQEGFKSGNELPENAYRGGGYDAKQGAISFSIDPKIASRFATVTSPSGTVIHAELKPSAKVVTVKGIDYAEDLNDRIAELRKKGVDAVYIDGEKEVAVINPSAVKTSGRSKTFKSVDAKNTDFTDLGNKANPKSLKTKLGIKPLNEGGYVQLPGGKDVDPLESLKQEAKPATGARSDYSPENLQANRQIRAKNASSITYADKKTINPDELVTVYRAVPGKAKGGLVEGDWVTPNKEQARLFMKQSWAQDDTGAKIVTKKVKASELRYHADDAKGYVDDELLYVPKSTQSQPPKSPIESLKQEARQPANAFQDTLPSKSRPASIRELVKRGGNPLYHDTNASGVLGILDSGEIRASQAPFSQIAGQGKRVSTTRNFDNYSRYGKSPYRFVIDETKTGQKAIPDNREEFESIFKNNVKTDSVETLAIDITNPEIINDMNNGRLAEVIAKAKEKGIRVETFEGKILPDEYANKEIQQLTKDRFTKEFGKATQPPKSTASTKTLNDLTVEAKPPTPFEQNLQTAGLAPQPTKGAIPERVQKVADTKLRSGTQEMPNQQTAKSQAALKQPSAADRRSLKISDQANQTQRSSQPQSQSPVSKLIEGSFDDNSTTKQIKVKGKISDADYRARYGKDRAPEKVKIKPFKTEDYAFEAWKDKGALGLNRETLERNLDRVAGSDAPKVKKFLVDASRNNESNRADFLKDVRGRIRKDVVEGLGIRAKSKESDLVQKYGEGIINDKQLADMAGNKADSVKKAADYFRKEYDSLLDQWNKQRRIHGLDEVPKRSDYFRHFQEISDGISQVGVILNRSELPTSIAGITDIFKPNKPFSNAELRRMGNKTTFDAVSGMDDYLDSVSRQIFHTDTVQRGRSIENAIRKQADENNKIELPNFVANLGEWTNIVSGKKTRVDRAAEALVGRKIYGFTNWARKQTGANMVGANLSSAMSNFIPFTQSLSTTDKRAAVKGLMTSLSSALKGNKNAIDGVKSSFLNRRFMDEAIDARGIRKASEIASTPFRLVDEFTSRAIVAGKYFEGKAKGLLPVDAMKQADDYAAKTLADRSIGQTPNLFNSQTMGLFTQFQLEVNNQLSFLSRDIPEFANGNKAKIASSLTQFAVFSYLFNTAYEEVTGRRPQIDPIQAALDIKGDSDEDSTPYERLGKASERITTGIPGAGIVTDGGRLPINSMMPDFSALGKAASNVAKGDGAVLGQVYKGVSGPLFYGLPPFGGGQLRKTVEGAYAALQGESKTPAGKKRFDIQQDPLNVAKAATFGQYATQEGKEYISKLSDSKSGIKKSGSSSISSDVDSILKAQFSTKEQRAWLATSATDKKEAAKQDPEKAKWLKQYEATKRVNKNAPERPEGLSKESETILNWHNKRTPQQREKLAYTQNDYDYKLATAQFEEAKLNGTVSRAEMINKQQALAKAKVGKDFTKDTRESYNSLSKAELTTLAENDPNGKQIMADAIAYGDALVKAGLIKKNKLRTGSGSGGRRGGRGGKGRASKFDYTKNLFDSGSDSASTSKQLRAILQKAMSGKS